MFAGESVCLYSLCISVIKRKAAERRLGQEPDPNGGATEGGSAGSRSHSAGEKGCLSVMGTFASLYIPETLAPDCGLCRLPSMAEATLLQAM